MTPWPYSLGSSVADTLRRMAIKDAWLADYDPSAHEGS